MEHGVGGAEYECDNAEDCADATTDDPAGFDAGDDDGATGLGHVLGGEGVGEVELDEFEFCVVFGADGVGCLVGGDAIEGSDDDRYSDEEQVLSKFSHPIQI